MASSGEKSAVTPYFLFLMVVTTFGPLQFGYHLAELNAPEKALRCLLKPKHGFLGEWGNKSEGRLPSCIPMEPAEFALVSSIYTLGGFIGALAAGPFSTTRGRKLSLRLTAPFFLLGSLLEAAATGIVSLGLGRFLAGIGAGASLVVGPVYISEISPPHLRGTFGAATQVMTNLGILFTQVLGYFFSTESMWRFVLGTAAILAAIHFLGLFGLVESHEWLDANGRVEDAKQVLNRIRAGNPSSEERAKWGLGESTGEQEALLTPSISVATAAPINQRKETIGILAVMRHPDHWPAVVSVIAAMLAQQLCGINSVMMYSVNFLSPLMPTTAGLITVAVGVLNLLVTAACSPLADRLGRKVCLMLSIAGMGINSLLLAFSLLHEVPILTGIATLLFVASFAVGLGPVPFILASELVGPEAVGATQSIALGANWSSTFLVAQFFPMLNAALGGRVFFIFAALALVFLLFIGWWVPESKGKANADEVWGRARRED